MRRRAALSLAGVAIASVMASCCYFPVGRYQTSTPLVAARGDASKVTVDRFTSSHPGRRNFNTRLGGIVSLPEPAETYIWNALVSELSAAGIYAPEADKKISGHITDTSPSAWAFRTGVWIIAGKIYGDGEELCSIASRYEFSPGSDAAVAADKTARAFPHAVRKFVATVLQEPEVVDFLNE